METGPARIDWNLDVRRVGALGESIDHISMRTFFLALLFSSSAFAAICETESYVCKANGKSYTRYMCSGGPDLDNFCETSLGHNMITCATDRTSQTLACNEERKSARKTPTVGGVEPANVNRDDIVRRIGSCTYDLDNTIIAEIKTDACKTAKFICRFTAKCSLATPVTGQCFAENGKCPSDPIDCIALRDIVGIKKGKEAVAEKSVLKSSIPERVRR